MGTLQMISDFGIDSLWELRGRSCFALKATVERTTSRAFATIELLVSGVKDAALFLYRDDEGGAPGPHSHLLPQLLSPSSNCSKLSTQLES